MEKEIAQKGIRIYYADDDGDDLFFFTKAVQEIDNSAELVTYQTGVELLEKLELDPEFQNIIFLDVNMPLKNGIDCLKDIKSNDKWSDVPVFLISTSDSAVLKEKLLQMGATGYIQKPVNYKDLKARIKEVVTTGRL